MTKHLRTLTVYSSQSHIDVPQKSAPTQENLSMSNIVFKVEGMRGAERLRISANADGKVTQAALDAALDSDPHYQYPQFHIEHLAREIRLRRNAVRLEFLNAGLLAA